MTIRQATVADVPALVGLGMRFIAETTYADKIGSDPAKIADLAHACLAAPNADIFVADTGAELVGCIALHVFAHPMSGELTAAEMVWWVVPEARGVGVRLYRRAEQWAKEAGAVFLQMIAPVAHANVGHFYEMIGFTPVETMYQRRLT